MVDKARAILKKPPTSDATGKSVNGGAPEVTAIYPDQRRTRYDRAAIRRVICGKTTPIQQRQHPKRNSHCIPEWGRPVQTVVQPAATQSRTHLASMSACGKTAGERTAVRGRADVPVNASGNATQTWYCQ